MKKIIFLSFILFFLLGCGPRYIYPHLDWLVPWYVSDYISLDAAQKNMLQQRLQKQLDWHCRTQLPTYAETLRAIGREFADPDQPLDFSKIQSYNTRLTDLWKKLMKQIGPDMTDILITASDEQIAELFENLAEQNREFSREYVDLAPEKLNENRQKRMVKRVKYWISDPTAEQTAAISSWSQQLVPLSQDWLQNREMIQSEARRLLVHRSRNPEFRATLLDIIVNPEQMRAPAYQAKVETNTELTLRLIIQLDRLLTPAQRSYLVKRIYSLATDFDKLSCDPKELPIKFPNQDL